MKNVELGSGNVYADLDMPDGDEMHVKAQLVLIFTSEVKQREWSPQRAADVLGLPVHIYSEIVRGNFRAVDVMTILRGVTRLGHDIQIIVQHAKNPTQEGNIRVLQSR
ncbi:helix-turn-helix domain-containing protein [Pandoraea commovens]|uniref:XRE family transcriptional regulator n=1 Tax=Pandoraea commovens TaxID=2508289 RepID=A0A5E4RH00_9BURK|nr:XRE family transcriptional regulator [Pandoraea commovens]VVD62626.1 XRE family transcriptional regulator [Pandoraea commovens]